MDAKQPVNRSKARSMVRGPQVNPNSCQLCNVPGLQLVDGEQPKSANPLSDQTLQKIGPWLICGRCSDKHEGVIIDDFWELFSLCLHCNDDCPKNHEHVPADFYKHPAPQQLEFYFCTKHSNNRCKRCWTTTDKHSLCQRCYHYPDLCICCDRTVYRQANKPHQYHRLCKQCFQTRRPYAYYEYYSI